MRSWVATAINSYPKGLRSDKLFLPLPKILRLIGRNYWKTILLSNMFYVIGFFFLQLKTFLQCQSIPGLLKPPNSYTLTLHSAAAQLGAEKARLPPMTLAPPPLTLALPPLRTKSPGSTPTTPRSMPSPILPEKNLQVTIAKDENCLNVSDKSSLLSSQK